MKAWKVFSLREFRSENSEGKTFSFTALDNEPIFGYTGKRHVKIYRPFSEIRFLYGSLLPENYSFGLEPLFLEIPPLFSEAGRA